ncbi:MAG: flagellar basal body rod protein FlgB [Clostridiales bacterium]|nr:flagellar basal body rod protein FlgB [Clostridiales bacterium]
MNILNDKTMRLINKALNTAVYRNEAISNNIANVNTRNYKANRVVFEEELRNAMNGNKKKLYTTHENHIKLTDSIDKIEPKMVKDTTTSMRQDGNNVDIDMENANLAANQLLYNSLIQQASKKISLLRYVISEGKR